MNKNVETWAEFVKRENPKYGDEFVDDVGNVWIYSAGVVEDFFGLSGTNYRMIPTILLGTVLTCPLKRCVNKPKIVKLWPAIVNYDGVNGVSNMLFENEKQAKEFFDYEFVSFPATQNEDGSYDVCLK